jgi:hypothetical protein
MIHTGVFVYWIEILANKYLFCFLFTFTNFGVSKTSLKLSPWGSFTIILKHFLLVFRHFSYFNLLELTPRRQNIVSFNICNCQDQMQTKSTLGILSRKGFNVGNLCVNLCVNFLSL